MNAGYQIYQAERRPSRAEQRAIDARRGELAAALSRLLRPLPRRAARQSAAASDLASRYDEVRRSGVPDYPPAGSSPVAPLHRR